MKDLREKQIGNNTKKVPNSFGGKVEGKVLHSVYNFIIEITLKEN